MNYLQNVYLQTFDRFWWNSIHGMAPPLRKSNSLSLILRVTLLKS